MTLRDSKMAFGTLLALFALSGCGKSASGLFKQENPNKEAELRWKRVRAGVKRQLADSQLKAGHLPEALRELEEALALDSNSPQGFILMARIRLEQGQLAGARQAADEAITLAPTDAEAAYVAGLVAERCEQWPQADQYYAQACAAAPQEPEYVIARAEALVALGMSVEALDWIESHGDRFLEDPRLRVAAARIYEQLGMNAAAADRFEQAARSENDNPDAKMELGLALSAARRDVEAAGILAPLLDDKNTNAAPSDTTAAVLALATSQYRLGRIDQARQRLETLTRKQRDNGPAWLLLARVACDQRDWRSARFAADQAVRLRGDAAESHLIRACICREQQDYHETLQSARLAIQREPHDPTGYCLLGQAYEGSGDNGLARAAYFDALAHDSQCTLARELLARLTIQPAAQAGDPVEPLSTAMAPDDCEPATGGNHP